MKKMIAIVLFLCFSILHTPVSEAASTFPAPIIVQGTTYVPIKTLTDLAGMPLKYDKAHNTLLIGNTEIYENADSNVVAHPLVLGINSFYISIKGTEQMMPMPTVTFQGTNLVPLSYVAKALSISVAKTAKGYTLGYKNKTIAVTIPKHPQNMVKQLTKQVDALKSNLDFKKNAHNGPGYKQLKKFSKQDIGKSVYFSGKVLQALEENSQTLLLVDVGYTGYESITGENELQVIAVLVNGTIDVVEDDVVELYGKVAAPYTYETTSGGVNTVPAMILLEYSK